VYQSGADHSALAAQAENFSVAAMRLVDRAVGSNPWLAALRLLEKMKASKFLVLAGILSLATGCAGNRRLQHIEVLRQDPDWPKIRAAAEMEVARKEGNTRWSHSAYYAPEEHTNGVWYVVASGAYPLNRMGDSIDIFIKDGGKVISYSPRMRDHPK